MMRLLIFFTISFTSLKHIRFVGFLFTLLRLHVLKKNDRIEIPETLTYKLTHKYYLIDINIRSLIDIDSVHIEAELGEIIS